MAEPKVILIGGAPGAGKSTLGREVARALSITSLGIDDLLAAAKAVTTPASHPGLHVMSTTDYVTYYTTSTPDQLIADATTQHEATWPAIERVIRNHAAFGSPIVIDGWAMRPGKVAQLGLDNVSSVWLVADPAVLVEREKRNVDFVRNSPDPEGMLENFLARSLWYNELIREQTTALGLRVLHQDGTASVEDLCAQTFERA